MSSKEKLSVSAKGQLRLQLKGRIFLANVTHILTASGPGRHIRVALQSGSFLTLM